MKCYLYNVRVFDTASDADTSFFPRTEPYTAIAESDNEAQRDIVDQLFAPKGLCGSRMRNDDAADRFRICFDKPIEAREVVWADEIGQWIWGDEDYDLQIKDWKQRHEQR